MIGTFGPIVFSVSSFRVLTLNNISHGASKRTAKHEVINGKPLLEHLGPDLESFSFDIHLKAQLGLKPRDMLDLLKVMAQEGMAYPLIIGGRPVGENSWSLTSVSDTWDTVYSGGELAEATVKLSLTEYISRL